MEIITFNELLERELEKLYRNLAKRPTPLDLLDLDLLAWLDYYFSKELPDLLHKSIMNTFIKKPSIVDIFFSESNKNMVKIIAGDKIKQRLYSSLFVTRIPTREMNPIELEIFKHLITSLNSNMFGIISVFRKIEAEYQAGTLVITPVETGESKNSKVDDNTPNSKKLKVNLSVKELAALFKLLDEVKPSIFEYRNKTEIYRFIANNFITKGKDDTDISENSIKNHFITIDNDASHIWESYLAKMIQVARESREK